MALSGDRIGVLGDTNILSVKEGPLTAPWVLESYGVKAMALPE
jgi:hypothetical protein